MDKPVRSNAGPAALTRRGFLGTAAAGAMALTAPKLLAGDDPGRAALARLGIDSVRLRQRWDVKRETPKDM